MAIFNSYVTNYQRVIYVYDDLSYIPTKIIKGL